MTLYNNGDYSGSARNMEQAVAQYLEIYSNCLAGCEGSYEIVEFKDFYPTLAGERGGRVLLSSVQVRKQLPFRSLPPPCFPSDLHTEALKCKVKCEESLTPSVGGFFVEKFVATMYHYLQFSYYKCKNDAEGWSPALQLSTARMLSNKRGPFFDLSQ